MSDFELRGGVLIKWNSMKREAIVPSGVRVIGVSAFNSYVKHFRLPEGVEILEKNAFNGLRSATIYLPKSIKEIKARAFHCFDSDTSVVYAGDVETFQQIKIAKVGNTSFIKYMENLLGVKSQATIEYEQKKEQRIDGQTKKQRIAEYLEKLVSENPIPIVKAEDLVGDPWSNIFIDIEGLFTCKKDEVALLLNEKTISAECARKLGKVKPKEALNNYCKYVTLQTNINVERRVWDMLSGKEVKWKRVGGTCHKEIPVSDIEMRYKRPEEEAFPYRNGIIEVVFEKDTNGTAYGNVDLSFWTELPVEENSVIQFPVRFRLLQEDIPTNENLFGYSYHYFAGKEERRLVSFKGCWCEDGTKWGCGISFCVGKQKYFFAVTYVQLTGYTTIKDYKIGQDEKGYYVDVLCKTDIFKNDCY